MAHSFQVSEDSTLVSNEQELKPSGKLKCDPYCRNVSLPDISRKHSGTGTSENAERTTLNAG